MVSLRKSSSAFLVLVLALLLCGCATEPANPYAMRSAADGMIEATQVAQANIVQQATIDAGRMRDSLSCTQASFDFGRTATADANIAIDRAATSTQVAVAAATGASHTDVAATRTEAIATAQLDAQLKAIDNRKALDVLAPLIILAVFIIAVVFAVKVGWNLFEWLVEWRDREKMIWNTASGPVIFVPTEHGLVAQPMAQIERMRQYPMLDAGPSQSVGYAGGGVTKLTASGSVLSAPPSSALNHLAVKLLRETHKLEEFDNTNQRIAGYRDVNWSAETWQRVIDSLRAEQAVEAIPGRGTYVTDKYQTTYHLLSDLETRKLVLSPTLTAEVS